MAKKVCILTYGCSANVADSEIMAGLLKQEGFELVSSIERSDLNIINTCMVKTPTEHRMIYEIQELTKTNKPLIVAGCMPKTSRKIIEDINPSASIIGPDSIEKIVYASIAAMRGNKAVLLEDSKKPKLCLPRERKKSCNWSNTYKQWLSIQLQLLLGQICQGQAVQLSYRSGCQGSKKGNRR